ncbi:MAG: dethiobiotin synthase [Deltaproteobacteria bacterium]|nr:dethiobiotin synthase [Deltaproteobacteria bacterium]
MTGPVCPRGVFVVGTDTGVGKTLVAAGLARMMRRRGNRVAVFKPFLSGDAAAEDAQILARAAGLAGPGPLQPALLDVIAPFRFRDPVAPGIGARREGCEISLGAVVDDARALGRVSEVMVVEGAGGVLVPLTHTLRASECVIDLVVALGLPVVVVGRTALGTINHTALTMAALRARGVAVAGIVLSQVDPAHEIPDADLLDAIHGVAGMRPLCVIPFVSGSEAIRVGTAARKLDGCGAWDHVEAAIPGAR